MPAILRNGLSSRGSDPLAGVTGLTLGLYLRLGPGLGEIDVSTRPATADPRARALRAVIQSGQPARSDEARIRHVRPRFLAVEIDVLDSVSVDPATRLALRSLWDRPWRMIGYVEAVATDPDHQGRGVGRAMMARLREEIAARWPVAMLSTGRATGFYESLGWERWRGPSYTRTGAGTVADDEHGGLMILRLDPSVVPDLAVAATCEDRSGDAW